MSTKQTEDTHEYSEARCIVKEKDVDVTALINLLNCALATEYLANYQYKIVVGSMFGFERVETEAQFTEHAKEEEDHANLLIKRILELGGTPIFSPYDWQEKAKQVGIEYLYPKLLDTLSLVNQNIGAEVGAIRVYNKILDNVRGVDPITYKVVRSILEDEVEHERDLRDLAKDINFMLDSMVKKDK